MAPVVAHQAAVVVQDEFLALPHDQENERAVLGAILIDNAMYEKAAAIVTSDDFYRLAHRWVYDCIGGVLSRGEPADLKTVAESLRRNDLLEEVGPAYLASLTDGVPYAANVEAYARIVAEKARLRRLFIALTGARTAAHKGTETAADILAKLDEVVREGTTAAVADVLTIVDETELGAIANAPMVIPGYLASGVNFIIGAPNAGKTTLAYSMAVSIATGRAWFGVPIVDPGPVLILAAEGAGAAEARLRAAKIAAGLDPSVPVGVKFIPHAVQLFDRGPAYAALRRYIRQARVRTIVIDHFALNISGADENNASETTAAINAARELGCAVAFVHHLDKSNKAERGSSAIRATTDGMLSLIDTDDLLTLTVEKIRDGKYPPPLKLKLVEVPEAGADGACSIRLACDVHQTSGLSKNQHAALGALWDSFGESASASRVEWLALMPTVKDRTAYHAISRLVALGYVTEVKGRYTAARRPPPIELLQGSARFAMPLQGGLQSSPQSGCNQKQAQKSNCNVVAMPLQGSLQSRSGGSLEPPGTLQKPVAKKTTDPATTPEVNGGGARGGDIPVFDPSKAFGPGAVVGGGAQ